MKKIMKKALSLVLALVMVFALTPMTAKAAPAAAPTGTGTAGDPYVVTTDETTYMITLEANTVAYVSTGEAYNATINGVASTGDYSFKRGMMDYSPVESAEDGTATVTLEESNVVMVCSLDTENTITVYLQATAGGTSDAPAGTMDDPEIVTFEENPYRPGVFGANLNVELAAGSEGYYYRYTATETGAVSVGIDCADAEWNPVGWMYYVNNTTAGKYGDYHFSDDEEVVYTEIVPVTAGDVIDVFVNTYNPEDMWSNPAGIAYVNFGFLAPGSSDYPEEVTVGEHSVTREEGAGEYYYTYTATEAGTLKVTIDNATAGWQYSLYNLTSYAMSEAHTSADETAVLTDGIEVAVGDEVQIIVGTFDAENPWTTPAGKVDWALSFTANTPDVPDTPVTPPVNPEEPENLYTESTAAPVVGDNELEVDTDSEYTVFIFEPTEAGVYTFTTEDSVMGIVGYYYTMEDLLTEDVVKETTFKWECANVGPSIYIAVKAEGTTANISIERDDLVVEEEIPWTIYENLVTPVPYVYTGNAEEDLYYIDFEDEDYVAENFTPVYNEADGFYHLGNEVGPVILVNLTDAQMSLVDAAGYGQLKVYYYDENDELVERVDFNDALLAYYECADAETGLYPLTVDLMNILQEVGEGKGWYGEDGFMGVPSVEDGGWMYACYFEMEFVLNVPEGDEKVAADELKDVIEEIKGSNENAENPIETIVFTTPVGVTFEFVIDEMEVSDDVVEYNFKVEIVTDYEDATEDDAVIEKDKFVVRVNFAHEGKLPGTATITIPVGMEYADETLYYYQIMEDGTLKYTGQKAVVDAAGNFIIEQDHCSDYVISAEVPEEELPPIPDTGDSTNFALWFAVLGLGVVAIAGSVVMKKREF